METFNLLCTNAETCFYAGTGFVVIILCTLLVVGGVIGVAYEIVSHYMRKWARRKDAMAWVREQSFAGRNESSIHTETPERRAAMYQQLYALSGKGRCPTCRGTTLNGLCVDGCGRR